MEQVKIEDLVIGTGISVLKGALCFINYEGYLEDGTLFDSTEKHGRPFELVVGSKKIIQGMSQGLLGMKEGGKRKIFVPATLAYGDRQIGSFIQPQSNLIFIIELIEARLRE
ncbi:MAG: FKBP-type peptidyl-prolyl cis-trans isomerase [Bdellovibrionaceae bacterium]|nr:FKBP-type peptidyl-prolyl cis-trans isomerase [Pseudobdellovibrionaceae bacterium]NUM58708.1 FKBP-type peptidyl-prolyl cis-trans isomerase [Pseudobdellovibrionaceae bacterium]